MALNAKRRKEGRGKDIFSNVLRGTHGLLFYHGQRVTRKLCTKLDQRAPESDHNMPTKQTGKATQMCFFSGLLLNFIQT